MRQRRHNCQPPRFAFWSRGELLRLGVIASACAVPLMMPHSRLGQDSAAGGMDANATGTSAGRLRAVHVTRFDVTKGAALAVGDADEAE